MEELKTLKDMEYNLTDKIDGYTSLGIFSKELRQEAIKWVKELDKEQNPAPFTAMQPTPNYEPVINFIKHFFNLTEEDLKESVK